MSYFKIIKLNATPSTNDYLKIRHRSNVASDGELVWALDQTKGRGQRENSWESDEKNSLTFSIYKRFEEFSGNDPFLISVVVSLALVYALEQLKIPNIKVKWPNDILSVNKKIGGVLIENIFSSGKISASVIGVGLNLNQETFSKLPHATSLKKAVGIHWHSQEVLNHLIPFLETALLKTDFKNSRVLLEEYQNSLWRFDQLSCFDSNSKVFKGLLKKVEADGSILLKTAEKEKHVTFPNVRMRYDTNCL